MNSTKLNSILKNIEKMNPAKIGKIPGRKVTISIPTKQYVLDALKDKSRRLGVSRQALIAEIIHRVARTY